MAKNLKVTIKNSQLAEALKLTKLQKAPAEKPPAKRSPPPEESVAAAPDAVVSSHEEQPPVTTRRPASRARKATAAPAPEVQSQEEPASSPPPPREEAPPPSAPRIEAAERAEEPAPPIVDEPLAPPKPSRAAPADGKVAVGRLVSPPRPPLPSTRAGAAEEEAGEQPGTAARPSHHDRTSHERPAYGERRPYGDRPPPRERTFGERPPYRERAPGERSYTDRPPRDRPAGDRPAYGDQQRPAADRPAYGERRPYGDRPTYGERRPAGDRPAYGDPQRPAGDRPAYGERRPYGDRPPRTDRPPYGAGGGASGAPRFQREGGAPGGGGYRDYSRGGATEHTGAPGAYPRRPYQGGGSTGPYVPRQGGARPGGPFQRPPGHRPPHAGPRPPFANRPPISLESEKGSERGERREERRPAPAKDFREVKSQKKLESPRAFDARARQGLRDEEEGMWRKRRPSHKQRANLGYEETRPKTLSVRLPITVKDLAAEMKLKASELISKLFLQGIPLTLNDSLDDETTIQLLGHEFDCEIAINTAEEKRIQITDKTVRQEISETPPELLATRPPVVAFMGHVDHGKTTLIDKIRQSNVAAKEAGAITQHIGAFTCHTKVGNLTVLDTPGHEAFAEMRARGAVVTDIIVLVVAGDEGIRAQTDEAILKAKEAGVPIVVAVNKCDKPNFDIELVYRQLADRELLPEAWGGTTITINCSAVTGQGLPELLEMLALQAEVLELRANPESRARGTVIESEMHKGMGSVATILVQNGTLRLGDAVVFDEHYGRIKTMQDEYGQNFTEAGPSTPMAITGLSGLPDAGSEFIVVRDEKEARSICEARQEGKRHLLLQQSRSSSLEKFMQNTPDAQAKKVLNLIIKADVQGSVEALKTSLKKIHSDKIDLNIVVAEVGEISESDVTRALASKATILGFHTRIESHAETLIKQSKVIVKLHDIIYHAVDEVKKLMLGLLDKVTEERSTGAAEVIAVFKSSQLGLIAGCRITEGTIHRNHLVRQMRGKDLVWKGSIASIKRLKDDVREVSKGFECGILLQNNNDVKVGDVLQAYDIIYLDQEL